VFKVNADGTEFVTLVNFGLGAATGRYPLAGLVQGTDGALYGTTSQGGTLGDGTVFKVNADGTGFVTLVDFGSGAAPGRYPLAGLVQGADGALYGTTSGGGVSDAGTAFKVNADGTEFVTLVNFGSGAASGRYPLAGLVQGSDGALYGTTVQGGASDAGTVFKVNPDGTGFVTLVNLTATTGAGPNAGLLRAPDGAFYGTTYSGGPEGGGVVFRLGLANPPVATVASAALTFGSANIGQVGGTQSVTVGNAGGGTVSVTGVSVTGDFQVTNGCTGGVAGGASCSIQVAFVPALAGLRTGILTITTDAGGPFSVALSGTGTAPAVTLAPASLGFGAVAVGAPSAPKTATLTNTGDGPLTIASIATTGDYAMTSGCPLAPATLAAGAGCTVSVTFTPTATGSRPGTLTITDDAAGSPRTVNLTGSGATVDASPSSLGFGGVPVDTTAPTKTVTLINSTAGATAISSISITSGATDYTQTNGCPATLAAGETCIVTVAFRPVAVGSRPGKLGIVYGSTTLTVNLSGSGTFNLGVSPGSLTFAKQAIGTTSAAKTVTLSNANGRPISLTGFASVAEFPIQTNGCGTSLAAGATCTVTVAFSPTATGTRAGQLTIADDATGNPHKVNFSGTGTLPLTVSPTSLGFGSVVAGVTSAAKTVTLTNPNPQAITFASITPSGDYALTNGCPAVLAPSSSCTLTVAFTPTAKGSRPAVLDILSDATTSPQKVNLNGTGTLPLNTTGGLSFGSVVAGVTSPGKTITLSNPSPTLPITLSSIGATGDFAATDTCGGVVAPSGSCTVSVTFTPTATGSRSGKMTVQSDATNNPRPVNLSGTGTLPLTVTGGPVAFGNLTVGSTSAPKVVTLTNTSPLLAIPVTGIETTGDFAQTNDCGTSIPAGSGCTVTLTFGPTTTGTRSGQLTVTSGATTSPNRVNLSGRGI
jgi:uncharacterized repeat protein (TIGR03803 family)